ncbi:hypothetical protein [Porphyrobacter sp. LM 6]|uniref:hypothetical protein n=1 Tax=Porphyrobacter sp. LM 6 TaxID=1896196 RepID=UPI0012371E71|nr:hypothetical protein [Porphyrobacter sp. LM 6]
METYGCACASRSYTKEEIEGYRAGAARNDLNALAEMQEYHVWRAQEHDPDSQEYKLEKAAEEGFRQRRIALRDPEAIDDEVSRLLYEEAFDELSQSQRLINLKRAKALSVYLVGDGLRMSDYKNDDRPWIATRDYISRELGKIADTAS